MCQSVILQAGFHLAVKQTNTYGYLLASKYLLRTCNSLNCFMVPKFPKNRRSNIQYLIHNQNQKALTSLSPGISRQKYQRANSFGWGEKESQKTMSSNIHQNPVALFIKKTYGILQNDLYQKVIHWLPSGNEFAVVDIPYFQEEILPKYFRHNNIHSFVRQLNMYGFHKCRKDPSKNIFGHQYFRRGREDLLPLVKRKIKIAQRSEDVHNAEQSNLPLQRLCEKKEQTTGPLLLEKPSQYNLMVKRLSQEKQALLSAEDQNRCSLNLMICPSGEVMNENPEIYSNMRVQEEQILSQSSSDNISIDDEIEKQRKATINLRSGVSLVQTHTLLRTQNHIFNDS